MKIKIIKAYSNLVNFKTLIKKELKSGFKISFQKKLHCYASGFLSESYIIYNFSKNKKSDYLSDFKRFIKTNQINFTNVKLLDNKLFFDRIFETEKYFIKAIAYVENGKVYSLNTSYNFPDIASLLLYAKEKSPLLIKPITGGGGKGIIIINGKNPNYNEIKFKNILERGNYLIYNRFSQIGFSNLIFPSSLNTIRVLTMYDPYRNKPFIAAAVHRFGTSDSGYIDNWTAGGICADIDISTGKLSKAVQFPFRGKLNYYSEHPETFVKIEGKIIPEWKEIKDLALKLAKKMAFLPYIGWDFILSGDEIFLLEANSNTDVNLLQVHKPLLINDRIKKFYKYYGVI